MVELDDIRMAFGHHNWDRADWLSDDYEALIDYATAPKLDAAAWRRINFLDSNIDTPLNQTVARVVLAQTGLLPVYEDAIAQARVCINQAVADI